jgi:hypothetical protein
MEEERKPAEWHPSDVRLIKWFMEKGHEAIPTKQFMLYPWRTVTNPEKWKARLKECIAMGPEAEELIYVNLTRDLRKLKFLLEGDTSFIQDTYRHSKASTRRFVNGANSRTNANIPQADQPKASHSVNPETIF